MKDIKGTKTEQNLREAFAGESQARNKYTYYASKARKDGFEQIAAIFEETANNEKEHAKLWFFWHLIPKYWSFSRHVIAFFCIIKHIF